MGSHHPVRKLSKDCIKRKKISVTVGDGGVDAGVVTASADIFIGEGLDSDVTPSADGVAVRLLKYWLSYSFCYNSWTR